jgi:hypothetical protein
MPGLSPLDATRHHSIVREHADDIHNINFTVAQTLRNASRLRSTLNASLQEIDRSRVDGVLSESKQTFDKFKKKYQPTTPGKDEKALTAEEAYWIFFSLSGSDFDKSVKMAEDMTKVLRGLEEILIFLEEKRRYAAAQ